METWIFAYLGYLAIATSLVVYLMGSQLAAFQDQPKIPRVAVAVLWPIHRFVIQKS